MINKIKYIKIFGHSMISSEARYENQKQNIRTKLGILLMIKIRINN